MFEFFDTLAPENAERLSETRTDRIKASVLSRIKEERPMKKHFGIKTLVVAAAIMTTGAVSVIGASAATTRNFSDIPAPTEPVTNLKELSDEEYKELKMTLIEECDSEIFDFHGNKVNWIEEKLSDMEFIGEDSDGTRHYKSRYGSTTSICSSDGDYSHWSIITVSLD
ncbi:MAG: hypothetical protein K2N56_04465 [Oscillospiraceae bacterium]|nr:hypothetical protein [Oscillospiraceae bacterium]